MFEQQIFREYPWKQGFKDAFKISAIAAGKF